MRMKLKLKLVGIKCVRKRIIYGEYGIVNDMYGKWLDGWLGEWLCSAEGIVV